VEITETVHERVALEESGASHRLEALHWNTPIYHDGFLYAFSGRTSRRRIFRCVEFKTGKLMWDHDEKWASHRRRPDVYAPRFVNHGRWKLIVLGEGGLLVVQLNPQQPRKFVFPGSATALPMLAAPILSKKRLIPASEDRLLCLNTRAADCPAYPSGCRVLTFPNSVLGLRFADPKHIPACYFLDSIETKKRCQHSWAERMRIGVRCVLQNPRIRIAMVKFAGIGPP